MTSPRTPLVASLVLSLLVAVASAAAAPPSPESPATPAAIEVTPRLKASTSWNGALLHYPDGQAEITGLEIALAPSAETGWHTHPAPSFGVVLEGEWTVMLADGRSRTFQKGETVVEVVDTPHNGRNTGRTTARVLVFYAGAAGQSLTQKQAAPPP